LHEIPYNPFRFDLTDGSLLMDRLTNGWLPLKTIAIPSSLMYVSRKPLPINLPKLFISRGNPGGREICTPISLSLNENTPWMAAFGQSIPNQYQYATTQG